MRENCQRKFQTLISGISKKNRRVPPFFCLADRIPTSFEDFICHRSSPSILLRYLKADENLSDGANEELQLGDVAAFIMRTLSKCTSDTDRSQPTH